LGDSEIEVVEVKHVGMVSSLLLRGHANGGGPWTVYLLARLRQREVGVLTFFETESGRACHLHELFVAPRWRRRGVGGALVRKALKISRERGYSHVTLLARPLGRIVSRALLKRWYEQLGFEALPGDVEEMKLELREQ
jgi:ribosomal protein S18 acetylase RimI-like enzyme